MTFRTKFGSSASNGVGRVVYVGKVSEGTRSSGRSTSTQNTEFSAIPRNSVTRTCPPVPPPPGKYHPGCGCEYEVRDNKKVSYRKQIARQHSCRKNVRPGHTGKMVDRVEMFLPSSWITVQTLGTVLFEYRVRACRRSQKFRGCWNPAPLSHSLKTGTWPIPPRCAL